MKRLLSHRSAQSLVVAVIAVVLALAGTALATSGSGRSRDASAVAAKKKHRRPSRLVRRYVARYVKHHPGPRGRRGAAGDDGTQGLQGPQGPAGKNGTAQITVVQSKGIHLGTGDQSESLDFAECPTGQVAVSGGYAVGDVNANGEIRPDKDVQIFSSTASTANADGNSVWLTEGKNYGTGAGDNANAFFITLAYCAPGQMAPSAKAVASGPLHVHVR